MARAIWKGELQLGKHPIAVKLFSAAEDRTIRFRMLHAKDRAPVVQHIVRKDTGKEVPKEDVRKAFTVTRQKAVILRPEELEELAPAASRDIHILRFVPPAALGDQWYERPYYLGPDGADSDYFALAEALGRKHVIGIVRWVMRNEHHVGGLTANDGYLTISTLRRADQVLRFSGVEPARTIAPLPSELKLAERLVASISADFDPSQYQNQHRKRLRGLIEAKARGEKIEPIKPKKKTASADLAESLRASIAAMKERKVA